MENMFRRVNSAKVKIPNGNTIFATESIDASEISFSIFDGNKKIKEFTLSSDELKYVTVISLLFNFVNLKEVGDELKKKRKEKFENKNNQ